MSTKTYNKFLLSLANKEVDLDSDSLKAVLLTNGYTPDLANHQYKSSLTNEVSTVSTTLAAAALATATSISSTASIPAGTQILIDAAGTPEIRTVTAVSGAGPYTLTVAALSSAHSSGATIQASPGYTAGGQALTSVTTTFIAANSFPVARANSTAYAAGQVVRPASGNGFLYQAATSGTSGGTVPTYPTTNGGTVTDGGVTWVCIGTGAFQLDAADPAWPTSSIIARYMAVVDSTPGSDATRPLLTLTDFVTDFTSSAGTFTVPLDPTGILLMIVP